MITPIPKVSILVPVYNVSEYLEECMDSLISQTLEDIEIVCVNDGSTDNSLEILKKYATRDERIKIISKPNGGLPSARNAALDVARGEYVGFVDSDDYVSKDMFKILYNTTLERKSDIVVCGGIPFPDDPEPTEWIKNALSPRDIHYIKFTKDLIFKENGSRPYIWRMLVKRSLIEDNNIRLDESVIIGEDQAFQMRVYPRAKGVTFISDKLYFYRWYREGSLMVREVYSDYVKKVDLHINLIEHVMEAWMETGDMNDLRKEFLVWSVELIYDDFVRLPLSERIRISDRICKIWDKVDYWSYKKLFPVVNEDMFDYIYSLKDAVCDIPELTVIVTVDNSQYWFESCIDSILTQTKRDIEIICINNGTDDGTFIHMHNLIRSDSRVSLINQCKKSDIECWQLGLEASTGEYVIFMDSSDRLLKSNMFEMIFSEMDYADMICYNSCINYLRESVGINTKTPKRCNIDEFKKFGSIHQFVFKKKYLYPLVKDLPDCSWFNEWMFMTKVQKGRGDVRTIPEYFYEINKKWIPDRIATWQANMILDAAIEIVKESQESGFFWMQEQVVSTLNSDYIIRLIVDNTLPSVKNPEDDPEGMASEVGTWCKILDLNSIIDTSKLERSLLRIVEVYVNERHRFLDDVFGRP